MTRIITSEKTAPIVDADAIQELKARRQAHERKMQLARQKPMIEV